MCFIKEREEGERKERESDACVFMLEKRRFVNNSFVKFRRFSASHRTNLLNFDTIENKDISLKFHQTFLI